VDKDGHDFEYYALKNKNPEILETALRILGKEPNSNTIAMRQKNDDEINVKVVAATKNIESRFRKILSENYSDLNMALNYALHRDQDYELIEAFVTAGADINFSDKIIICYYECLYREELSYKKCYEKCHKNKKEDSGGPLIIAVKEKCTKEIIQLLIESGANVNDVERHFHDGTSLPDTYSEWSPLPSAIHNISDENPDYEIMNILINAGANINFRYRSGQTPLFGKVIYSDNPDVISTLINYGIDVNVQDQEGNNVLMKAMGRSIKDKLPEIVRILLNAGINVNAKAADGNTALILAARENCQMEVIQALVEAGADINAQENNGETVLMWAARSHQSPELISFLVKSGADINAMDNNKATVTDYARRNPNPEVLKTVLSMSGQ
jgi:ankyrin repeat protein